MLRIDTRDQGRHVRVAQAAMAQDYMAAGSSRSKLVFCHFPSIPKIFKWKMENPFLRQNGKYRMQECEARWTFMYWLLGNYFWHSACDLSTSDPWQEKYFYAVTSINGMTQSAEEHVKDASVIPNSVLDNLDFQQRLCKDLTAAGGWMRKIPGWWVTRRRVWTSG